MWKHYRGNRITNYKAALKQCIVDAVQINEVEDSSLLLVFPHKDADEHDQINEWT